VIGEKGERMRTRKCVVCGFAWWGMGAVWCLCSVRVIVMKVILIPSVEFDFLIYFRIFNISTRVPRPDPASVLLYNLLAKMIM
jgi:hypothetical protein